jgi:hypothetical protein
MVLVYLRMIIELKSQKAISLKKTERTIKKWSENTNIRKYRNCCGNYFQKL